MALLVASFLTVVSLAAPATAGPVRTQLVSRFQGVDAVHGHSSTFGRAIYGNGRFVVFSVNDDGLPGSDGTRDIYVRDRDRRRTRLVSKNSAGNPAEVSSSDSVAISQDGRFVAFATSADNLPGGPGTSDVYLHDLRTGKTRLVSRTSGGDVLDDDSGNPSVSASGRFVAFSSEADNLPGDDTVRNVYVHDRRTGRTRLVSKTSAGAPAGGNSDWPSLSADGSRVSFSSQADNLPGPDGISDVFVHDLETRKTRLVSKTSRGRGLDASSLAFTGSMSANGRIVAFESAASNLRGGVGTADIYIHDIGTGRTRLVSKTSRGEVLDGHSSLPSVSGSGRLVAFESEASNLPGRAGTTDVYVHDRRTGRTRLISRATSGAPGEASSFYPSISADGRFVTFTSHADNFSSADDNDYSNAFIRGPRR